jgi:hypothetical protein
MYLKEDSEWIGFIERVINPVLDLERGKLGEEEGKDKTGLSNSSDNIFDDDFIRGDDFGMNSLTEDKIFQQDQ